RSGPRCPLDLVGFRGGRRHLPSRSHFRSRPRRRGAAARGAVARAADRARLRRRRAEDPGEVGMSVSSAGRHGIKASATHFFSVWNLAVLLVLLIVVFSILKGDTFLTAFTFQSMVNSRSINALIALAVMIPLAANNFDLSVASILGISQVLANGLQ